MGLYQSPPPAGALMPQGVDPAQMSRFATQMQNQPEDVWQPQYDRTNLPAAGAFEIFFFTIPVGGSATLIRGGATGTFTKTRRDTSLEQQGVIPTKSFLVRGFSMTLIPVQQAVSVAATASILDDICRICYGGFFEFRLIDKPYLYLPLSKLPSTGVIRGSVATTATNVTMVGGGGVGDGVPASIYWLTVPLLIEPYQNFSARMQFDGSPALGQSYDIQLFMEGIIRRPGQ